MVCCVLNLCVAILASSENNIDVPHFWWFPDLPVFPMFHLCLLHCTVQQTIPPASGCSVRQCVLGCSYFYFGLSSYLAMLRDYSWLCVQVATDIAQGSFVVLGIWTWVDTCKLLCYLWSYQIISLSYLRPLKNVIAFLCHFLTQKFQQTSFLSSLIQAISFS